MPKSRGIVRHKVPRLWTWVFLGTTCVFLILWLAAWIGPRQLDVERMGSFGSLLGGLGTTFALVVSIGVLWKELAERKDAEWDRRVEQARRVCAWAKSRYHAADGKWHLTVIVHNSSDEPVHQASIFVRIKNGSGESSSYEHEIGLIPPGKEEHKIDLLPGVPQCEMSEHGDLDFAFTDSAGRRWLRNSSGQISPY